MTHRADNPYAAPTVSDSEPAVAKWATNGRRTVVPWGGRDVMVVFALALGLRIIAAGFVAGPSSTAAPASAKGPVEQSVKLVEADRVFNLLIADSVASVVGFVLAILWLVHGCRASSSDLGFDWRRLPRDAVLGFVASAVILPIIYGLLVLLNLLFHQKPEHPIEDLLRARPETVTLAVCVFAAVVLAPLIEEFMCRGVLQGWLERLAIEQQERAQRLGRPAPVWVAAIPSDQRAPLLLGPILITSLVFAGMHFSHGVAPIPLFFLAVALGYLYQRTRRLWASIVVHASLNTCSLVMLWIAALNGVAP